MKNGTPTEQCSRCGGTGKTPLSDEMLTVYEAFTGAKEYDAIALVKHLKWQGHPTAINNRLEHLRSIGLLERRKSSKTWIYRKAGGK